MAPSTLNKILQKFYVEVRKQNGSEYEPDSLKVMQAALERHLSAHKHPYSVINSSEFPSSRAALDAKAKQLRMQGYGKKKIAPSRYQHSQGEVFLVQLPVRWPQLMWLWPMQTSKICPITLVFEAAKTTTMLTYKTSRFCGFSLREEKWRNAYVSTRIHRRPVLVAWQLNTKKHHKKCGPRRSDRSCQTLRRVSQQATFGNANLWSSVLGHNSATKNRILVCQTQNGSA